MVKPGQMKKAVYDEADKLFSVSAAEARGILLHSLGADQNIAPLLFLLNFRKVIITVLGNGKGQYVRRIVNAAVCQVVLLHCLSADKAEAENAVAKDFRSKAKDLNV